MSRRATPRRFQPEPRPPASNRKGRQQVKREQVPEPDQYMIHDSDSEELDDSPLQSAASEDVSEEEEEEEEEAPPPKPPKPSPKRPARSETAALTGHLAPFSTLSCRRSHDPVLSAAWELHGRLVTFKWKQLLWMLRAREALGRRWRRNPRWLAVMFSREAASIYGHMGASVKYLRGLQGPALFK
jgi:hypothetical protein